MPRIAAGLKHPAFDDLTDFASFLRPEFTFRPLNIDALHNNLLIFGKLLAVDMGEPK